MKVQHRYINFLLCRELAKIQKLVKRRKKELDKKTLEQEEALKDYKKVLKMVEVLEGHIGEEVKFPEGVVLSEQELGLDNDEFSESV